MGLFSFLPFFSILFKLQIVKEKIKYGDAFSKIKKEDKNDKLCTIAKS